MLNETYPDPVQDSFRRENTQRSGAQHTTCKDSTIADTKKAIL
jgi:hypothetical protein